MGSDIALALCCLQSLKLRFALWRCGFHLLVVVKVFVQFVPAEFTLHGSIGSFVVIRNSIPWVIEISAPPPGCGLIFDHMIANRDMPRFRGLLIEIATFITGTRFFFGLHNACKRFAAASILRQSSFRTKASYGFGSSQSNRDLLS
jgi:hypothetical protein